MAIRTRWWCNIYICIYIMNLRYCWVSLKPPNQPTCRCQCRPWLSPSELWATQMGGRPERTEVGSQSAGDDSADDDGGKLSWASLLNLLDVWKEINQESIRQLIRDRFDMHRFRREVLLPMVDPSPLLIFLWLSVGWWLPENTSGQHLTPNTHRFFCHAATPIKLMLNVRSFPNNYLRLTGIL